jgi:hypothetical protein
MTLDGQAESIQESCTIEYMNVKRVYVQTD